ncbi:hypothetical protein ACFT4A_32560 [Streptomyces sp. NPDC057099]|uniref:MoaF-related domain-containing protein n=1 Tax=Streptomyces sp. NPDC057099 TaxID=3346019 RepID=UPI00363AFE58
MHYETLEGPGKGAEETVTLHTAEVAPGLFMLGWVETSGMTITPEAPDHAAVPHRSTGEGTTACRAPDASPTTPSYDPSHAPPPEDNRVRDRTADRRLPRRHRLGRAVPVRQRP